MAEWFRVCLTVILILNLPALKTCLCAESIVPKCKKYSAKFVYATTLLIVNFKGMVPDSKSGAPLDNQYEHNFTIWHSRFSAQT